MPKVVAPARPKLNRKGLEALFRRGGLTKADFCRASGVSEPSLYRYLRGHEPVSALVVREINSTIDALKTASKTA